MSIVSSGQLGNIQSKTNAQASINFKSQNTSVFSEQIYETIDYVTDVLEDFADVAGTALATGAVVATTIISGVAKVVEYVADGVIWLGGTVISWVQDLFGYDTAAEKMRQSTMNTIARDVVGEMNKDFYENSILGRAINSKSLMKYDSELAKTIQNITVKAVELTAAIALTVATGGLCAPLAAAVVIGVGSLEGIGKSAEERYQDPNRSYDTGAILLDGFGNGLNWYATGKLGQGGIQALSAIKEVGAKTAAKAVLGAFRNAWQYKGKILTKDFLKNILKSGLLDLDNLLDSFGIIGDNLAEWANGGEFDAKQMAKELALAYGLNCLMDGFTNLLFKAKTISMAEEQAKQLTKEVVDLTTDSSAIANDVNSDISKNESNLSIFKKSDINGLKLKNDILINMPHNLTIEEQARYLYIELNKKVNYDPRYTIGESPIYNKIKYDEKINFTNLKDNNIICKGWSELYSELLMSSGIDTTSVKIMGGSKNGSHKWVEISLGNGKKVFADATQPYSNSTDLMNCKAGNKTGGFLIVDENIDTNAIGSAGVNNIKKLSRDIDPDFSSIDSKIGYSTNGTYYGDALKQLKSDFSDRSLIERLKKISTIDKRIDNLSQIVNQTTKDMGVLEKYSYLKQLKYSYLSDAKVEIAFTHTKQNYESNVILSMFDSKNNVKYFTFDNDNNFIEVFDLNIESFYDENIFVKKGDILH